MTKRARTRAARGMKMMMRVAGNGEGEGGKAMAMAIRVVSKRTLTVMKRAMVTKMRLGGAEGGNDRPLRVT